MKTNRRILISYKGLANNLYLVAWNNKFIVTSFTDTESVIFNNLNKALHHFNCECGIAY
jgi:hypothetical protein